MPTFKVYKGTPTGIQESETTRPDLRGDQVLVKVTASGICGTDLHYKSANTALGHEGVGVVRGVGPSVQCLRPGDRVGWGYQADSCGLCTYCLAGSEEYGAERKIYGEANLDQGISPRPRDAEAAPMMCGGATVWNALRRYGLSSSSTVGVLGLGGLGHLAVQFAARLGMNVVLLSTTDSKRDEAPKMGTTSFIVVKDQEPAPLAIGTTLDALVVTSDFKISQYQLLAKGIRIQGTVISSRVEIKKMLAFMARQDVKPQVMTFAMDREGIESAIEALEEGKMRYRGVLTAR